MSYLTCAVKLLFNIYKVSDELAFKFFRHFNFSDVLLQYKKQKQRFSFKLKSTSRSALDHEFCLLLLLLFAYKSGSANTLNQRVKDQKSSLKEMLLSSDVSDENLTKIVNKIRDSDLTFNDYSDSEFLTALVVLMSKLQEKSLVSSFCHKLAGENIKIEKSSLGDTISKLSQCIDHSCDVILPFVKLGVRDIIFYVYYLNGHLYRLQTFSINRLPFFLNVKIITY